MSHSTILLILGILGLVFYATAPIFFPHLANLRQPELLPVYSLMIGLGGLLKKSENPFPPAEPPEPNSEVKKPHGKVK